jgi:signal transduction histidine kinase
MEPSAWVGGGYSKSHPDHQPGSFRHRKGRSGAIAPCLFRVLQEALQNAVKHSGARHLKAELRGAPEEIQLTVNDQGVGFEEQDAINRRGIGLISMR